jgi:hypothetical protein
MTSPGEIEVAAAARAPPVIVEMRESVAYMTRAGPGVARNLGSPYPVGNRPFGLANGRMAVAIECRPLELQAESTRVQK